MPGPGPIFQMVITIIEWLSRDDSDEERRLKEARKKHNAHKRRRDEWERYDRDRSRSRGRGRRRKYSY